MSTSRYELSDRYLADEGTVFLTGIQALARLPLEQLRADRRAGLNTAALVAGYPGSPLGGYGDAVAAAMALAPELPVSFRPGVNEELSATAVMGSQLASVQADCRYDGIVGIWHGKAPGVDRAADALRHAVYAGASMHGGAVAVVGDDPAAKSSTVPSSSAALLADMHMPLLYPGDPAEALDLGRHAIALSRSTGLWSALKIVADVADATSSVNLHPDRISPVLPTIDGRPYTHAPDGRLLTPHTVDLEREIFEVRYELSMQYASANRLNHVTVDPADAWLGIVASGITYRELRDAFAQLGLSTNADIAACGIRLLKMGMPIPFDPATIRSFARGLDQVFVVEEKQPNMESLIKDALYSLPDRPTVVGKADESGDRLLPGYGALDADAIAPILRRRIEGRAGERIAPARPEEAPRLSPLSVERTPFFCSGCPHNRSTLVEPGTLVGAGIGCHTMTLLMAPDRVGDLAGLTCMGNEGAQWIGMADFVERKHFVQNLGDGTFFHSGQLAIQAAVAAKVNVTYKLLYNGTVAMTGGQDPQAQLSVPAVIQVLLAQGVRQVIVTTEDRGRYRSGELPKGVEVWGRDRIIEAQKRLAEVQGVTVLIHDQACAAETRRARKRGLAPTPSERVVINQRLCEGCGDCGRVSNCLSVQPVETPFGRKTQIDETTCNLDYSCLEGDCPSFITVRPRAPTRPRPAPEPPANLPEPELVVPTDDFAVSITGIGGTGVVTVAQVLGTAAMLDGYHVRGLDQIGLSQKAGPVVSDIRLSRTARTATNRLGRAHADLLLALDQLVAASERGLLTADPQRTAVVGSTAGTPTGEMITHPEVELPSQESLRKCIAALTRADAQHWADAQGITRELFGQTTTANVFVMGMAVQAGCLPVTPGLIEEAIRLNGVAVEANVAALRWGRAQVASPEAVAAAREARTEGRKAPVPVVSPEVQRDIGRLDVDAGLAEDLARYASELVEWQDEATALDWLAVLDRVATAERSVAHGSSRLLGAVAANLFKLTAYKDEYEVARLMTSPDALAEAREIAGARGAVAWKLHPPILRGLGMRRKITVGSWLTPAVRALAGGKRLRGTLLDPFRRSAVRGLERQLPGEYVSAIDRVLARLTADNLESGIALAELPDIVRGYEKLKLERIAQYREKLSATLRAFD